MAKDDYRFPDARAYLAWVQSRPKGEIWRYVDGYAVMEGGLWDGEHWRAPAARQSARQASPPHQRDDHHPSPPRFQHSGKISRLVRPQAGRSVTAPAVSAIVPILRSFDETATRDFYLRFLGFEVTFEHRFDPAAPLYIGVRLGTCELHLSEHYGDATPGAGLRIEMEDVEAYRTAITGRGHPNCRPGIQNQEWGWREVTVKDPNGNRLVFCTRLET